MPDIKKNTIVPYTAEQMFNLVNKIEEYPQFIPFCQSSRILSQTDDEIRAMLEFAKGGFSKSFGTINRLQKNKMIEIRLLEGPFKHLEGFWRFEDLPNNQCKIMLDFEFEFSSRLLAFAFEPFFVQAVTMLVDAFKDRAKVVYG